MATRVAVGVSNNKSSLEAGRQLSESALKQLGSSPDFAFVFSSDNFNQDDLMKGVNEVLPGVKMIGGSSAGIIVNGKLSREAAGVMVLKSSDLKVVNSIVTDLCEVGARQAGVKLAEQLQDELKKQEQEGKGNKVAVLVVDGFCKDVGDIVDGFHSVLPDVDLIGGASGDNLKFFKTYQFYNGKAYSNSVAGMIISSELNMGVGLEHGWVPIENLMKVTKSEGKRIYEINNKPAFLVYQDVFKELELSRSSFAEFAMIHPFGIKQPDGTFLIRDPLSVNEDDSINCVSSVPQGSEISIMFADDEQVIKAAGKSAEKAVANLNEKKPGALIIFDCVSRLLLLEDKAEEELKLISEKTSRVPSIGLFTFGEIGGIKLENPCFHNKACGLLVLPE